MRAAWRRDDVLAGERGEKGGEKAHPRTPRRRVCRLEGTSAGRVQLELDNLRPSPLYHWTTLALARPSIRERYAQDLRWLFGTGAPSVTAIGHVAKVACSRHTATDRRASATCTRAAFAGSAREGCNASSGSATRKSRRSEEGASCLVLRMRTRVFRALKQKFVTLLLAAGAAASVRGTAGKQAAGRLQPFNQRWGGYRGPMRARRVVLSMVSFLTSWPPQNDARSLALHVQRTPLHCPLLRLQ